GQSVLNVKAADGDMGSPNSVSLAIVPGSESCPGLFDIDKLSGEIRLKAVPDRDSGKIFDNSGSCNFQVQATEGNEHLQSTNPPRNVSVENVTITIEDVDDNKPVFLSQSYVASVAENTQEGVPITLHTAIKVKDIDQGENARFSVRIKNLPDVFEASPDIVQSSADIIIRIKNASYLDYESRQTIKIEIEAQPVSFLLNNNWNSAEITLNLLNLNDELPEFSNFPRSISVAENVGIGYSIITALATDKDSNADGKNFGKVTFSLDNPDSDFRIDLDSGTVYTQSVLDRETKDTYYITIAAEDGGQRKVTAQLSIKVTDVNDETPSFVTDDYQTSLQEGETKFIRPITVHATDNDDHSTNNSVVKYSIISTVPSGLLNHFLDTGSLSVLSALSYESIHFQEPGKITLTVMAEDQGKPPRNSTVKAIIMLQDINNKAPVCGQPVYQVSRPENLTSAHPVVTVHASDADGTAPNNVVMYSIDQHSLEKFIVNSSSGEIVLRSSLDRETQNVYTVTVTVTDFGIPSRTGSCQVSVTVLDINDTPPVFLQKSKEVGVKENTTNLHFNMSARDEDSDNKLYYDIDWSQSVATDTYGSAVNINIVKAWLILNHSSGDINSVAKFDREQVKKFTLYMLVRDEKSQTGPQQDIGTLTVTIEDINDQVPTFIKGTTYNAEISENMPVGSEISFKTPDSLIVQDLDEAANSIFTVKLLTHVNDFSLKKIDSKDGQSFSISVLNASILDYEKIQRIELKLVAVESNTTEHFSSTATVTVSIINKNDNMPEFIGAPFQAHVKENEKIMTSVTQVTAKDDDLGVYGTVFYSLLGNQNQFIINKTTGVVYTNQSLDREKQQTYSLSVHVQDSGGFGTTTQLTVTVDDENDVAPRFRQRAYNVTILENQQQFTPPLLVEAYDEDEAGNLNSKIEYSIISLHPVWPMIKINSDTGEIFLTGPFDYEAIEPNLHGVLTLTVQAQDQGVPKHSVNQTVTINVKDVNDETPRFQATQSTARIAENVAPGTQIFHQSATDRDSNVENKNISYSIDTLSAATFTVGEKSGSLTLKNPLDREKTSSYDIILTARDHGVPVLSSTAVIHIEVMDINDEKPHFGQNQISKNILENRAFSYGCSAKDSDSNPNLVYSIDWPQSNGMKVTGETVAGSELMKWIEIKDSRVCSVTSVRPFDRESISRMTIKIQVNDTNGATNLPQVDFATLVVDVLDENDYPPTFNSPSYTVSIQENMPAGSNVKFDHPVLLQISDLDEKGNNSHYTVSVNDSLKAFTVEPVFGDGQQIFAITVLNSSFLDFESIEIIKFEIIAKDQKHTMKADVTVNIINENDNIPEFNSSTYTASVLENSPAGFLVTSTVKAFDKDKGEFGKVSYSLKDVAGKFDINSTTGYIYTKTSDLDRETAPTYIVTVTAQDTKGFSSITQLTISITDVNDNPPVFTQQEYTVSVDEGFGHFQPPFFVYTTDADDPSTVNSKIEYSLLQATAAPLSNFGINSSTGELVIKAPLDFEALSNNVIVLNIQAKDKGAPPRTSTTSVTVTVNDINDEAPHFSHSFYNTSVLENVTSGHKVSQVHATDRDKSSANNVVSYRLDALSENKFLIQTDGTITVKNSLDREQMDFYNITVTAFDNGQPMKTSTAIVSVNIADVNDSPPQFNTESASITVTENSNKIFYTCSATDPDKNKNLRFSIDWPSSSGVDGGGQFVEGVRLQKYIRINNVTGDVSPMNVIDREATQRFQLTLTVEDMNGIPGTNQTDTALLTVVVNDENDNPPGFLGGQSFLATILENTPVKSEVKLLGVSGLIIEDPDADNNNIFIINMTKNSAFYIEPTNGTGRTACSIKVADSTLLDYEKVQNFTFTIIAQDVHRPNLKSQATIFIQLENENDNIPEFIGAPYKSNISEESQPHTFVTTVTAKDADIGKFGDVAYYLVDDSKKFGIDRVTGEVFSLVDDLDRETQSTYIVTVLAKDFNNFTATTQLTIDVTDYDDMPPVFSEKNYIFKINEGEMKSGFFVHADDADEPNTPNSCVLYTLIDADPKSYQMYFTIDNTSGEITVQSPLDYETISQAEVNLTVQAQDLGTAALTGTANIEIVVLDINDKKPRFPPQNYAFLVPENAYPDTPVGGISAKDDDATSPNNEVFYAIQSGSQDKFQINSTSGVISVGVGAGLDRESLNIYQLVVLAIDRGTPAFTSSTQVTINITDVNDVPPVFSSTASTQSIPENASLNTKVFNVSAKDLDTTAQLKYSILWNQSKAFDEKDREVNISKNWLDVNESSGVISVASELDRETAQQIVMKVVVEDVNALLNKPQTATASVTVILTDVNDNPPVIHIDGGGGGILHLNVSEGTKIGTEVTTLIATDADKEQGVTFTVSNSVYFIISSNGRLKLNSPLDREKQSKFSFVVMATDTGSPPLSSNISVDIRVLDTNDNDPEFIANQSAVFFIKENATLSTSVGHVSATDRDEGANGFVTYEFRDVSPFAINNITGEIFVAGETDRETMSSYTLTVLATDNPELEQRRRASLVISIVLNDTNDQYPVFNIPSGMNYTGKVGEDRKINDSVNIQPKPISATDKDIGQNANVTYMLQPSDVNFFKIEPLNGQVFVNESMMGSPGDYSLTVVATDHGEPPLETTAYLTITILDVNDNRPYFIGGGANSGKGPIPSIPECTQVGFSVYTFMAEDDDKDKTSNALVRYYLLNSTDSPDADYFVLDPDTGILQLKNPLSSEQKNILKIAVQAKDSGDPQLSSDILRVNISVLDINDHRPEFDQGQKTEFSLLEESQDHDTEVGTVTATDQDIGSQLHCEIDESSNQWRDFFEVVSKNNVRCVIYNRKPIDRENITNAHLNLKVKDRSVDASVACKFNPSPDNKESKLIEVTINILDINDNPPVFVTESMSKGFLSNSEVGKTILNLNDYVTDRDTAANSKHQFYQLGQLEADEDMSKGWAFSTIPDPIKVDINGSVKTNYKFPEDRFGAVTLKVLVNDSAGNDTLDLKIFVVGSSQVVEFSFYKSEDELMRLQQIIAQELSDNSLTFIPDDIVSFKDGENNVDGSKSVLLMHAIQDGKIIDANRLKGFKRKLKAATIEVHGMEPMKFPGLEDNPMKDSNPIFMRDDVTLDSTSESDQNFSYSQRSENSLDKNALDREEYAEDEQEVTMNMYGGDDVFSDPSELPSPVRYMNDVFLEEDRLPPRIPGDRRTEHSGDDFNDDDDDNVFNFNVTQDCVVLAQRPVAFTSPTKVRYPFKVSWTSLQISPGNFPRFSCKAGWMREFYQLSIGPGKTSWVLTEDRTQDSQLYSRVSTPLSHEIII
ncbi:hypothetical protein Btru_058950, partial [Bulinus truncatus]